jgi:hypothetical protein
MMSPEAHGTHRFAKKRFDRIDEVTVRMDRSSRICSVDEAPQSYASPFAVFAVLADFAIAGSLCVLLHNRRTIFKGTNNMISTLIIYAINRCLLTSYVPDNPSVNNFVNL